MSEPRDDRVSQLMHELADAAPRPPEWDDLSPTLQLGRRDEPDRRGVWLLAAAAVVAVVGVVAAIAAWTGREEVRTSDAPVVSATSTPTASGPATVPPGESAPATGPPATAPTTAPEGSTGISVTPATEATASPSSTVPPADPDAALVRAYLGDLARNDYEAAARRLGDPTDWLSRADLAALAWTPHTGELAEALAAWCAGGALCAEPAAVRSIPDGTGGPAVVAEYELEGATVTGTFAVADGGTTVRGLPPLATADSLGVLAEAGDADSAVARLPGDVVATWEATSDGAAVAELGPVGNAWLRSDGEFLFWEESTADEAGVPWPHTRATRLDGSVVCEADGFMHRLRQVDGRFVASVERRDELPTPTGQDQPVPNYAVDCESGERTAIDPISWTREGGDRGILRVGDRTFDYQGDAEGNADITNESGVSINGDDYAGYHTFSPDGGRVVYADFTDAPGPHYTDRIRARDTATGALLWTAELPGMFGSLHHTGERVLVAHPAPTADPMSPWESTSWVDVYDADTGELLMTVPTVLILDDLH